MDVPSKFYSFLIQNNILLKVNSMLDRLPEPDTHLRVKFVQKLMKNYDLVPQAVHEPNPKNNVVAKLHRAEANNLYRNKKYVEALVELNKDICYADGAESLSIGYAGRSAIYLDLELYDECLENIRLAREAGYPARLLSKLADREKKCHEAIGERSDDEVEKYQPKLSYPASADHPSVADCIELVVNEKYGRHFVAKQELKIGDIVILEKPFQVYLHKDNIHRKCANCLSENQLNLIPCPGCTKTMFCSRSCLESAKKFHKTLCPIADKLFELPPCDLLSSLQILLSLIHDFGSVQALAEARASRSANTGLPKYSDDEQTHQRNLLDAFHDMEPVFEPPCLSEVLGLALVYCWLMDYTDLAVQLADVKSQNLFLNLHYRYCRITKGIFPATEIADLENGNVIRHFKIATNFFPIINLLNHSCAPNIVGRSCNGSLMAAMVERPVKKGEQLFICYDTHHMEVPKIARQEKLLELYNFTCDCEACEQDYPGISDMMENQDPKKLVMTTCTNVLDQKENLDFFEKTKVVMQMFDDSSYPCMMQYYYRTRLLSSFSTLCHNYTLAVKLKYEEGN